MFNDELLMQFYILTPKGQEFLSHSALQPIPHHWELSSPTSDVAFRWFRWAFYFEWLLQGFGSDRVCCGSWPVPADKIMNY